MPKRKFSTGRLYKVVKTLVIVVSILAALISIVSFHRLATSYYMDESGLFRNRLTLQDGRCFEFALFFCGAVAVALPAIFFGGVWLYKYLFPETKED